MQRPADGFRAVSFVNKAKSSLRYRKSWLILALALMCSLALAQPIPDAPAERSRKARETEQALAKLREDVASLKAALATGQRSESDAVAALAAAERAVSDHRRQLADIAERSAAHQAELTRIAEERTGVDRDIERQRDALAALLRLIYARSRQAPAKLLLDPERAPRLARSLGYGRVLQRARLARIDRLATSLTELTRLAEQETAALSALETEREAAEVEQAALAAAVAEREVALDALRRELGDQRSRLTTLNRDERAMVRLLEQLRDIFADLPKTLDGAQPFRSQRGRLPWPVKGRTNTGDNGGLLIAAEVGTPVHAVGHGRIAFADWLKGYGLLVIVDHGDGYMSLYGHNDALLKSEGAWVQAGDVIAHVGRSGGEDQSALYFELRERGRAVDARPWLSKP